MKPTRILIVEDEIIVALDLQDRLSDLGYEVTGVVDRGDGALALVATTLPDLVLMDIRLKGEMDGIAAAEQIRRRWRIPVVYLTAFSEDHTLQRAKVTEPFGYIIKPFEDREIQAAIEMALYKHQAEQRLRESERRYATTLTSIGDGVIATDSLGGVTFMNPVAERLTGWAQAEAHGRPLAEVFKIANEQTRQAVEDPVAKVLREGKTVGLANHTILFCQDGREIPIDDCAAPILDDFGQITGTVLVFQDVTERRRKEAELRRIEWMLSPRPQPQGDARAAQEQVCRDLTVSNTSRLILDSVGSDLLWDIVSDYLDLLETSAAVYERNGDCAFGILVSSWCRVMSDAAVYCCRSQDGGEPVSSGRQPCHEFCCVNASRLSMERGELVDIACRGGVRFYAVPIRAGDEIVGSINCGYGDPPRDPATLRELAERYGVSVDELQALAGHYQTRPPFIIELAKRRLESSARLIGEIVQRRILERKQQESEQQYRMLFASNPHPMWVYDLETLAFLAVNDAAIAHYGYSRDEFLAMTIKDIRPLEDVDALLQNVAAVTQGLDEAGVWRHRLKDGRIIEVEITSHTLLFGDRRAELVLVLDITERKRAEDALRKSEERYRAFVANSTEGIWRYEPDQPISTTLPVDEQIEQIFQRGYIAECNDATARMYGLDHPEELIGTHLGEMLIYDSRNIEFIRAFIESGYRLVDAESLERDREGMVHHFLNSMIGVLEDGHLVRAWGVQRDVTGHKQVEESLRQANLVVENSPAVLFRWRAAEGWPVEMVSQNVSQFGYTPEELLSGTVPFATILHPEDVDRVVRELQEYSSTGMDRFQQEYRIITKDGGVRWVDDRTLVERNADGQITHYQGIVIDITDRKRVEEALLQEKHFTDTLIDSMPGMFYVFDEQGRLARWNKQLEHFTGYDAESISVTGAIDLIHPEDQSAVAQKIHEVFVQGESHVEGRVLKKDGGTVPFYLTGLRIASGDKTYLLGVGLDISERVRAEDENRRLRNYLANIIDSMPSVLVGVDMNGRVTQWNAAAQRRTGISAEEAKGQSVDLVLPALSGELDKVKEAVRSRMVKIENRVPKMADGEMRYQDVTVYPLVSNGLEGAVIRVDDVTERVRIEEMMIQSEKMLSVGGLAAGMAHEINNPLGAILQASQNIVRRVSAELPVNLQVAEACGTTLDTVRKYLEQREVLSFIEDIRSSGLRAAQIVENVLAFSRKPEAGGSSTDLAELLDQTLLLAGNDYDLKKRYDFRQIEILRKYQPDVPLVVCQASKIQQVFFNILRNGAEAMGESRDWGRSPRFVLRIVEEGAAVRVEIEDNGPGMDDVTRRRLFEPFFTTKPPGSGTGLGLSVSYFIVTEDHGGTLSVESQPGEGTRFIVRLPVAGKV
jgi:PAS domain S-box-containing protein